MVNETIISGLLNLFALFSARNGGRTQACIKLLDNYLGAHFGLRNKQPYIDLYNDLYDLYISEEIDRELVVLTICNNIKTGITQAEEYSLLLRLMEFCHLTCDRFEASDWLFQHIAEQFGIDDQRYASFADFVENPHPTK